jgi:L-rhamnose-H+ transport protein
MNLLIGLVLVFFAGLMQGTFILPMTLTRRWAWEHNWAVFSLVGMLVFNWALAAIVIPDLGGTYRATPASDLWALLIFGGLWGAGAILFGMGMDRLGMALGYPIIMGLILSLGALIPLLLKAPGDIFAGPGLLLAVGTGVTVVGIVVCSRAVAIKEGGKAAAGGAADVLSKDKLAAGLSAGLVIAVFAGTLSCLTNVGMNYADQLKAAAQKLGASSQMAGNAAWAVLFTAGFAVNFGYCLALMAKRGNLRDIRYELGRNTGLIALMSLLWIGSFYLYGMGAARLGKWGGIIGWPLFISLAIIVGNLWGLWRGEWAGAPGQARQKLSLGLVVMLIAVAVFGVSSAVKP